MIDIEKLDNELYRARYGLPKVGDANAIWRRIKNNPDILRESVKVVRNKWNTGDLVNGLAIANAMLMDYKNVDQVAYNELIKSIYTNTDIARIVIDGDSNGGYSFLLMSLWNYDLKLTEEQKKFAVNEAMNKIGTARYKKQSDEYSKKLDEKGITDDITTMINIDGCVNPIGAKTKNEYFNYMFSMMSNTQAHGIGEFDIRYYILRNPNWTLGEKQKLIMDFWYDDEEYDECLDQWEIVGIINELEVYEYDLCLFLDGNELLHNYTYEMLLDSFENQALVNKIWPEIQFCRQMHKLRPQQWELEFAPQKVLK